MSNSYVYGLICINILLNLFIFVHNCSYVHFRINEALERKRHEKRPTIAKYILMTNHGVCDNMDYAVATLLRPIFYVMKVTP